MSPSTSPPRRSRFRFLYQFSLRTLLIATAAVAVFCNWYFQPKYHEEELAEKELRLRRQMKMSSGQAGKVMTVQQYLSLPEMINHGNWSLLDGDDFTLTRGRFIENEATGDWAAWYPTGGKAAEGKMQHGVKVGHWRTWYEDGTLASDITFAGKPVVREELYESIPSQWVNGTPAPDRIVVAPHFVYSSSREGSARAWYESGKLKHEGRFVANRQDGVWTFYDEQGRVTETGPFRAGKRHGQWTRTRSVSEGGPSQAQTVHYIDGRTQTELDDLLARLKPRLASDRRRERCGALIDLADLGEGAAPLLLGRLARGDAHEQAAIVGMVPRMPTGTHLLLPRVRELLASDNPKLAHQARLTLFQLDAESRDKLLEPLLAEALAAPTLGQCLEELVVLYHGDATYRGPVFAALMELPLTRDDSDASLVAAEASQLGGDVTEFVRAACNHSRWQVRLQTVHTIEALRGWGFGSPSRMNKQVRDELLTTLQHDPSPEVRQAVEALSAPPVLGGPSGSWGIGSGYTGSFSF